MSALIDGYLNEDEGRVFEDEGFVEEKFTAGAEAYAAAAAEQEGTGYRELTGQEAEALRVAFNRRVRAHLANGSPQHCRGCGAVVVEVAPYSHRHAEPADHADEDCRAKWQCGRCGGESAVVERSPADVRTTCLEPGCGHYEAYNLDTVQTGPEADLLWQHLARARNERAQAHRAFWGLTDTNEEADR